MASSAKTDRSRIYKCSDCSQSFSRGEHLSRHERSMRMSIGISLLLDEEGSDFTKRLMCGKIPVNDLMNVPFAKVRSTDKMFSNVT